MNVKKKLKKFFTLKRRANDGFTLVELIVVIAIMAILAGVGTVAYSGYIKASNKGADKTLVGNIMRAVETGTNSYAFVNDDSFKMGNLSYPVGIITLSADKEDGTPGTCLVMASNSKQTEKSSECKMSPTTIKVVKSYTVHTETNDLGLLNTKIPFVGTLGDILASMGFGTPPANLTYYNVDWEDMHYCETHTALPTQRSVYTAIKPVSKYGSTFWYYDGDKESFYFAEDMVGAYTLYDESNGHADGVTITRDELEAVQNAARVEKTMSGELYDSLVAAFGDPSALKLSYANWGSEEGFTHGSANSYVSEAYTELLKIADIAADQGLIGWASSEYFGKNWDTPEAAMDDAVRAVDTMYGNNEEAWLAAWKNTANEKYDQCGFGMNTGNPTADKVGYNTLRMHYNQSFASYLKTKNVPNDYVNVVVRFDNGISAGNDVYLPAVVNYSAFEVDAEGNNPSKLKDKLKEAGDTDGTWFGKIEEYYDEYVNSPAYEENAKTVLALTSTMAENGAAAMKYEGGYAQYFQNYIDEMDAFYTAAENAAGDGIIIIVTVEKNEYGVSELNFQVSPSSANPRND